MAQIKIVDPAQATGKSKELLTTLQNNIKSVPNLAKTLANSPAALQAWMEFDAALAKGSLNAKLRQEIALAVGQRTAANIVCPPTPQSVSSRASRTSKSSTAARGKAPHPRTQRR